MILGSLFSERRVAQKPWSLPPGQRVYAVGDIHGRLDLLDELLERIARDDAARSRVEATLVFLGDYIDRGPDSRGVVERLMALERERGRERTIFLMGNHEEVLLRAADGDPRAAGLLNRIGGRETLLSYGVSEQAYEQADADGLIELVRTFIPADHLTWLEEGCPLHRMGDYVFVHAGIRPNVALDAQAESDLRWIRDEFLRSERSHGAMIVHGHTITPDIDRQANRIGLDTGAFQTGVLSAVGLEGYGSWFLQTGTGALE